MADDTTETNAAVGALLSVAIMEALVEKGIFSSEEAGNLYAQAVREAEQAVTDHQIGGKPHA